MRDWATSGRVKIKRAKEHVRYFDEISRAFFKAHAYSIEPKGDDERMVISFCICEGEPIPLRWSAIVADAVYNLRSALDVLWSQAMSPLNGKARKKQPFPIDRTLDELKAQCAREIKPRRRDALRLIYEIRNDEAGSEMLVALNEMDNRNKHEILTLVAGTFQRLDIIVQRAVIDGKPRPRDRFTLEPEGEFLPLKHGTEIFNLEILGDDAEMDVDYELTMDVAFGDGEVLQRESVVETLEQMTQLVEGIADSFLTAGVIV